jgi:hypothetical protein
MLLSGDDEGVIKLWDLRSKTQVCDFKENEDYISDMLLISEGKELIATRYVY